MRPADWDVRLAEWATSRLGLPFVWGTTDCALLALEAWDILTGADEGARLADQYRGRWTNEFGAIKQVADAGESIASGLLERGAQRVLPGFQQRGDVICVTGERHVSAHVCYGELALSAAPETGVAWFRVDLLLREPDVVILRAP
jgi:hypothetical protein